MTINLRPEVLKALENRADELGMEVEPMTNALLERALQDERQALADFDALMRPRLEAVERGEFVEDTVESIFDEVIRTCSHA